MRSIAPRTLIRIAAAAALLAACVFAGVVSGKRIGMWIANHPRTEVRTVDDRNLVADSRGKLVLYSRQNCDLSKQAKQWLTQHGVDYVERSIDGSKAALAEAKRLDAQRTPVMLIGGHVVEGFDPDTLADVLTRESVKFR